MINYTGGVKIDFLLGDEVVFDETELDAKKEIREVPLTHLPHKHVVEFEL